MKNKDFKTVTAVKLYSWDYTEAKTYVVVAAFVLGNILFPIFFHLIPQGGLIFLPIYFFTLLGAYKYGIKAGLLIAVLSPVINHLLTGMPPAAVLPALLTKSGLLAIGAAYAAHRFGRVSLSILGGVVIFYQLIGSLFEWVWYGDIFLASQDLRLALPGMLLQVSGVYALLKLMEKKGY